MRQKSVILSPAEKKAAAKTLKADIAAANKAVKAADKAIAGVLKSGEVAVRKYEKEKTTTLKTLAKLTASLSQLQPTAVAGSSALS